MQARGWLAIALLAFLVSACAAQELPDEPARTPTPAAGETRTPSPANPTATRITVPLRTISPAPTPTFTPAPQVTVLDAPGTSPDRQWSVITALFRHPDHTRLLARVIRRDGSQWLLEDSTHPRDALPPYPAVLRWSPDSRYLYFTWRTSGVGNCGSAGEANGTDLARLDTLSGEIETLWEGSAGWMDGSPDAQYWASLDFDPKGLLIRLHSLQEDQEWELVWPMPANPLTNPSLGRLLWSPDGRMLVFSVLHDACLVDYKNRYNSIVRLDLRSRSLLALVYQDRRGFQAVDWPEAERILVEDWLGKRYWLYVVNAVVVPVHQGENE